MSAVSATASGARRLGSLALIFRLMRAQPALTLLNVALWTLIHSLPVAAGVLFQRIFDALGSGAAATSTAWTLLAFALAIDLTRLTLLGFGIFAFATQWAQSMLRMRRNLLAHLLLTAGPKVALGAPAETISRFRDDVEDIAQYLELWIDVWGLVLFGVAALTLMARIDPWLTAWVMLPLLLTLGLTQVLRPLIRRVRRTLREATGRVTDFIGEAFGAVATVQSSGRARNFVAAFDRLGEVRRVAAVRDALLGELLKNVNDNMVHLATGLILLFGAEAMQRGSFSVGEFALFLTFLPRLTASISFIGEMVVQHRRVGVAFERLETLLGGEPAELIVRGGPLHLQGPLPPFRDARPPHIPLQRLEVSELCVRHPDGVLAVDRVSFTLERGSFTVITGAVGAGKSTLLRALIGLLPIESGEIRWNGEVVADPSSFFVPPRSAYTSQVPRLFSDTLRENVVLGRPEGDAPATLVGAPGDAGFGGRALGAALRLAVLEQDLRALDRGLDTEVGTRGVKLSGGQLQRSAAARMFMQGAELLVFDDLSSALDVETEQELWRRLAEERGDVTCLVVSHRQPALARADQILTLEGGRIIDRAASPRTTARSSR